MEKRSEGIKVEPIDAGAKSIEDVVAGVFKKHTPERENLIPVLQEVQAELGYLPVSAMEQIAQALKIPDVDVYSVATFYNQFRLNPPGRHQIKVCMGTACHMMGGQIILESFERRLGIKEGETTPDRGYNLERVACVGCCHLAPVVVVDDRIEGKVSPIRVDGILLAHEMDMKQAGEGEQGEKVEADGQRGQT